MHVSTTLIIFGATLVQAATIAEPPTKVGPRQIQCTDFPLCSAESQYQSCQRICGSDATGVTLNLKGTCKPKQPTYTGFQCQE
ncbi:hypothetical protein Cob_v013188 [Colletotrichum orbiculare MAFF 240422]|uniref:Uncharacterized protein n=1 Tax=Colletotrichum orbiculare (strain 104-T / ATCC 96160 / CBS 514.97 / LARS 414 / MAFF 240422) TaxID=1213857 RepID=A0A484F9V8_COLOR|nr:hypothetical protein Cob_v013188 [Colletotrichum orbiculare MAFF 240422]